MKRYLHPRNLLAAIGAAGYLLLLVITLLHRQAPLHDEPYFLANVALYKEYGLSEGFLLKMKDQAPGPLYQFVHSTLQPLTGLDVPGVRLVNVFFLGAIITLLTVLMRRLWKLEMRSAVAYALCVLAAPVMWQVSGMALTEVPSLLFSFASVVLLWYALSATRPVVALALALAAGAAAGLGILGRAPFLVLVPAGWLVAWLYIRRGEWLRVLTLMVYSLVALALCLPVFLVWKGLTPPQQAYISGGISIWHGLLGFGYAAMITLLLAPRWFLINRQSVFWLAGAYVVFLILNIYLFHFTYSPLNRALDKIMPALFMRLYPYLISPFLCVLAVYFMVCLLAWLNRSLATPFTFFLLAVIALLLCSNFAVTHLFSSRYIAQIVPFLIAATWPAEELSYSKIIRCVAGMVLGLLSLETYFNFS